MIIYLIYSLLISPFYIPYIPQFCLRSLLWNFAGSLISSQRTCYFSSYVTSSSGYFIRFSCFTVHIQSSKAVPLKYSPTCTSCHLPVLEPQQTKKFLHYICLRRNIPRYVGFYTIWIDIRLVLYVPPSTSP